MLILFFLSSIIILSFTLEWRGMEEEGREGGKEGRGKRERERKGLQRGETEGGDGGEGGEEGRGEWEKMWKIKILF